jgi:hypothetical protein
MSNPFEEIEKLMDEFRGGSKTEPINAHLESPHFLVHPDFIEAAKSDPVHFEKVSVVFEVCRFTTNPFVQKTSIIALNHAGVEFLQRMKFRELLED